MEDKVRIYVVSELGHVQVENAIDRATKEKRVAALTAALENSSVVFGLRYNKISVRPNGPCHFVPTG